MEKREDQLTWFEQRRMEFIVESLMVYGFINREHLERKFKISTPQASKDLNTAQRLMPFLMNYNKTAKRYEPRPGNFK